MRPNFTENIKSVNAHFPVLDKWFDANEDHHLITDNKFSQYIDLSNCKKISQQ